MNTRFSFISDTLDFDALIGLDFPTGHKTHGRLSKAMVLFSSFFFFNNIATTDNQNLNKNG
jgi:hypothetical protein